MQLPCECRTGLDWHDSWLCLSESAHLGAHSRQSLQTRTFCSSCRMQQALGCVVLDLWRNLLVDTSSRAVCPNSTKSAAGPMPRLASLQARTRLTRECFVVTLTPALPSIPRATSLP